MKKVTISDESYWKLMEIKVKLKCATWRETINELHKLVFAPSSFPNQHPRKLKSGRNQELRY